MTPLLPKSVLDYYARIGAEVSNFRRAVVRTYINHYYTERSVIQLHADGTITCKDKQYLPTPEEANQIIEDLKEIEFPKSIRAGDISQLTGTTGILYSIIDQDTGEILMVQERRDSVTGKSYLPWCLMNNGHWEMMEPDGPLPFWKPEKTKGKFVRLMIHEGAKTAKFVTEMCEDENCTHPWIEFLRQYEHWGMIGGALAPHRSDYQEIKAKQPIEVVYVCDNDYYGKCALPLVSKNYGKRMKGMVFGDDFPPAFDLADPMPVKTFTIAGLYKGPSAESQLVPATWATEQIPTTGKGRPSFRVTEAFAADWMHSITPEAFINIHQPAKIMSSREFDDDVRPFSDVAATSGYLKKDFSNKSCTIKYDPSKEPGLVSSEDGLFVNTYVPTKIKRVKGDVTPFIEFMEHFIPDPKDRLEVMRYVATLWAHPKIRINYGILMVSETQGVGKGTFAEKIAAPLVGSSNVSFPSEHEIVESNYNYWLAHKRLGVVHEIYAGGSSKAYNRLKDVITDKFVQVEKKYQDAYNIECWIHLLACSNSKRALKIAQGDRRWLIPRITEKKKTTEYWHKINSWLVEENGLGIVLNWAYEFTEDLSNIVVAGAEAPMTLTKEAIIKENYSYGQQSVERLLNDVKERVDKGALPKTTFLLDLDLVRFIKTDVYDGKQNDKLEKPATVRAVANACGWHCGDTQAQISGWGMARRGARIIALDPDLAHRLPKDIGGLEVPPEQRLSPFDPQSLMTM